jgi:hypothetical protein
MALRACTFTPSSIAKAPLVFDLVDPRINRLAYRAIRENVVHRDSFTDDEVREGVKHLLKGLKPN